MKTWKQGGCHCGNVKFKVLSEFTNGVICNCSICSQKGFLHLIVNADEFELQTPKENLSNYQFGTKTAKHLFCKNCGITSYYVPRSHPDGYSVNLRCVEEIDLKKMQLTDFDGKNWEQNIHTII